MDKFGRSKDIKHTIKFKSEDSRAHISNKKPVKEEKLLLESPSKVKSDLKSEPESEGPPVSKSIQSAILRNIIGDFGRNDDKVKEDSVDDVVSKIISGSQDHLDEDDFESRMKKIKSQVTNKAKAGVYGKVQLGQQTAATTSISKQKPDEQNNDKDLEDEAARLRRELLEMKQKIEDKKRKNRTQTPTSSSASESESESEAEEEVDEEDSGDESDDDSEDGSNESETDHSDHTDVSDQEEEKPSVFDIFKTTVLQKEKSKRSTHLYDDSMRKSKLVQTKTSKILKERMELLKRNTK